MEIRKVIWFILALGVVACFALSGCYTERTARNRFHKVAANYPTIPAEYCADKFKCKDSVYERVEYIHGDTMVFSDTVTVIKPGEPIVRTITKTITLHDTLKSVKIEYQTDKAALALSEMRLQEMTFKQQNTQAELDSRTSSRNTWRWIAIGLIAAIAIGVVLMIWRK